MNTPNQELSDFLDGKPFRINSVKNGIQSALQYLEMEIWNHENENPIDHLGEMYLQTMRVDPIIFSESEVPALKNYACQMISGTLLEV